MAHLPAFALASSQSYGVVVSEPCDSHLPISGSIRARSSIHKVPFHAKQLAFQYGLLEAGNEYQILQEAPCRICSTFDSRQICCQSRPVHHVRRSGMGARTNGRLHHTSWFALVLRQRCGNLIKCYLHVAVESLISRQPRLCEMVAIAYWWL